MRELPADITSWKNTEAIDELIETWQLRKDTIEAPNKFRQLHRELAQLYTIRIDLVESADHLAVLPDLYHDLTSSLLCSGEFAAAETTIGRALELNPDNPHPISYLPHVLLFQGQVELAKKEYLRLKDEVYLEPGPDGPVYYSDAFLVDFEQFEKLEIIPEEYQEQIEAIKRLLMV